MMMQYKLSRPLSMNNPQGGRQQQPKRVSLCGGVVEAEHDPRIPPPPRRALTFQESPLNMVEQIVPIFQDEKQKPGLNRISPATVLISPSEDVPQEQQGLYDSFRTPPPLIRGSITRGRGCQQNLHNYFTTNPTQESDLSPRTSFPTLVSKTGGFEDDLLHQEPEDDTSPTVATRILAFPSETDRSMDPSSFAAVLVQYEQSAISALVGMMQSTASCDENPSSTSSAFNLLNDAIASDKASADQDTTHKKRKYCKRNVVWWESKSKRSKKNDQATEEEPHQQEVEDSTPASSTLRKEMSPRKTRAHSKKAKSSSSSNKASQEIEELDMNNIELDSVDGMRLSTPQDHEQLNSLHCFVRSELLEACTFRVATKSFPRVGLRCVYCGTKPRGGRAGGASMSTFFPKSLEDIYRGVCTWQRIHFKACKHIPDDVKSTYWSLKDIDRTRGRKAHWVKSAYQLGLRNADTQRGGIIWNPLEDSNEIHCI